MPKPEITEELRELLQECTDLNFHPDVFATLVEGESVVKEAERWGVGDTFVREQAADVVMRKLIGQKWPTYGDGLTDEELEALVEAVQEAHDRLIPVLA